MKGALVLPDEWGAFLTFSKQVSWKDLGVDAEGKTFVCSSVLAMGSSSAVALLRSFNIFTEGQALVEDCALAWS